MLERYIETEDFLDIPLSGHQYSIDVEGTIKNKESEIVVPTLDVHGDLVVNLPLWEGWRVYKVYEVLMFTFKPTNIPYEYWCKLKIMFADGNPKNIHPSNLIWKYPVGLESKRYPGYAFVPGFSKYVISKEGVLINFLTGETLKPYITSHGYAQFNLACDVRNKHNSPIKLKRHRGVGMAWLDYPANVEELVINHLDCIPGSDHVSNLEWCTHRENCEYSVLMGRSRSAEILKDVFVFNSLSGFILTFPSVAKCARTLGISNATMQSRLKRLHTRIYEGYYQFSFSKNHDDWVVITPEHAKELKERWNAELMLRNVKTGEITIFENISALAKHLDLKTEAIWHLVLNEKQPMLPGYLQIKKSTDALEWREPEDIELENTQAINGTAVLARNTKTGEIKEYASAVECSKALGLCNEAVNARFNYGEQKIFSDGLQFKRKTDPTPWNFEIGKEETYAEANVAVPVEIRDVFTKEYWSFSTMDEAGKVLKIPFHSLMDRKMNKENRPYLNFEIRFNKEPFTDFNSEELELIKQGIEDGVSFRGRGYVLTDIETGVEQLFCSRQRILNIFGGAKTNINLVCNSGGIFRKKYRLRYYYDKLETSDLS